MVGKGTFYFSRSLVATSLISCLEFRERLSRPSVHWTFSEGEMTIFQLPETISSYSPCLHLETFDSRMLGQSESSNFWWWPFSVEIWTSMSFMPVSSGLSNFSFYFYFWSVLFIVPG